MHDLAVEHTRIVAAFVVHLLLQVTVTLDLTAVWKHLMSTLAPYASPHHHGSSHSRLLPGLCNQQQQQQQQQQPSSSAKAQPRSAK
jgi:hypothetical protein